MSVVDVVKISQVYSIPLGLGGGFGPLGLSSSLITSSFDGTDNVGDEHSSSDETGASGGTSDISTEKETCSKE